MIPDAYYIGYSLDTVLEAASASTEGKRVQLMATADLGSPLDLYGDMISVEYTGIIESILPGQVTFSEYMNPRFYYLPYDKVKISNHSNGAIAYPISGNSFDSKDEWEEMCKAYNLPEVQEIVKNKSLAPSKFATAVKNLFPKEFSDTFVKPMQNIRWRGIPLSQFSMLAFNYEFDMDHALEADYNEYFMRPNVSFNQLCNMICERYGVRVERADANEVKRLLTSRHVTEEVVLMDNRVDQYMDYVCGKFDRSRIWAEPIQIPTQLIHARDGVYYTPLSECWAVTVFDGKAHKLMSEPINTLYSEGISEIPSTKNNVKLYSQYADLITHYGNKRLDLGQRVGTMIK